MRASRTPAFDHRGWEWPAIVALAVGAVYVGLIWREDGTIGADGLVVWALIATPGVFGLVASRTADADRALVLRSIAAGALSSLAVLALFSIGLLLLVAVIGFVLAAVRGGRGATPRARRRAFVWAAAAAVVPWVVLLV